MGMTGKGKQEKASKKITCKVRADTNGRVDEININSVTFRQDNKLYSVKLYICSSCITPHHTTPQAYLFTSNILQYIKPTQCNIGLNADINIANLSQSKKCKMMK